jgi:hypothetical protein
MMMSGYIRSTMLLVSINPICTYTRTTDAIVGWSAARVQGWPPLVNPIWIKEQPLCVAATRDHPGSVGNHRSNVPAAEVERRWSALAPQP